MQLRPPFELLVPDRVRIGDVELRAHYNADAGKGEDRYVVEATASPHKSYAQRFALHELRHLTPADLPNGFYMSVESVEYAKLKFRDIHFLTLSKHDDKLRVRLTIALDHADWHLPVNLTNFAELYVDALSQSITAEMDRGDYGVSIVGSVIAPPDTNLFKTTSDLAETCLRKYRECIASGYSSTIGKTKVAPSPGGASDVAGSKWWMRYVVVPLLGSGAFAAAIAGLVALLK
jgi:hypothetical protein